jgi:hypothetical protein
MLKGYRTIIFNVIMSAFMLISLWSPSTELPSGEEVKGALEQLDLALAFFWGLGNIILRAITDTPIFKKD